MWIYSRGHGEDEWFDIVPEWLLFLGMIISGSLAIMCFVLPFIQ